MRTLLLSRSDENYLQKCCADFGFSFGLVIGQLAEPEKFIVVHLAKNGEEDTDLPDPQDEDADVSMHGPHKVEDIDTQVLTNQWISAYKMIPGSFSVLGIFVVSKNTDIIEDQTFKIAKKILYDVNNLLLQGINFCGSLEDITNADYLFLAYTSESKKAVCKSYTHSVNGGAFTPMECRIVEKTFEWHTFECSYELDDIYPIVDESQSINIENQFHRTIDAVKLNLAASEIFIQSEYVEDAWSLDAYIKAKNVSRKTHSQSGGVGGGAGGGDNGLIFKATIFLPVKCQKSKENTIKVRKFNGTIRLSGVISSRIWCNPKNTMGDVKRFIRNDILRSLAARIQVYCDGLTEANVSNDAIFISEPPRRVYFNIPIGLTVSPIQFSEYIFRGEAPTVAVAQAKQILDLDINTESIVGDVETLPDDETFSDISSDADIMATSPPKRSMREMSRSMYMLGITLSLLVLFVSILLHFLFR